MRVRQLYVWASGLLNLGRDSIPTTQVREFCGVKKGVGEDIEGSDLLCFGHNERIENREIAKNIYEEE